MQCFACALHNAQTIGARVQYGEQPPASRAAHVVRNTRMRCINAGMQECEMA